MEKLNILYIFDNIYADIAGISLTSLFENNPSTELELTVYLLLVEVSAENQEKFIRLAEKYHQKIELINANSLLEEIRRLDISSYRGSVMTNLRLHFAELLPVSVHRLLYLDCDTIICGSISELARFKLEGKLLGMALDAYGKVLCRTILQKSPYYNAGVLLIDCVKWRAEKWQDQIGLYIKQNGAKFNHPDQDIFNIVCRNEIIRLPIRFNFQTVHRIYSDDLFNRCLASEQYYTVDEIAEARKNPVIIHLVRFLGSNPWHKDNRHPDSEVFLKYKNISFWNQQPRVPIKKDLLIQTESILHKVLPAEVFFPLSVFAIKTVLASDKKGKY